MVKEGDSVKEGVVFAVIEVEETEETKPAEETAESTSSEELQVLKIKQPAGRQPLLILVVLMLVQQSEK